MRARLDSEAELPSVQDATERAKDLPRQPNNDANAAFEAKRNELIARQRAEREALLKAQEQQRIENLADRLTPFAADEFFTAYDIDKDPVGIEAIPPFDRRGERRTGERV